MWLCWYKFGCLPSWRQWEIAQMAKNSLFQSFGSQGLAEEWPIMKRAQPAPIFALSGSLAGIAEPCLFCQVWRALHKIAFWRDRMHYACVRERGRQTRGSTVVLLAVFDLLDSTSLSLTAPFPKWSHSCPGDWWRGAEKEHPSAVYKVTYGLPTMLRCSLWRWRNTKKAQARRWKRVIKQDRFWFPVSLKVLHYLHGPPTVL